MLSFFLKYYNILFNDIQIFYRRYYLQYSKNSSIKDSSINQKTWWFILLSLIVAAIPGIIIPGSKSSPDDPALSAGDTAWMLNATAMVLLMTPGLAFFMEE